MKPRVGDIVWYRPCHQGLEDARPESRSSWPATVKQVHTETDVTLHVYPPNGRIVVAPHASRGAAPGQWLARVQH